MRADVQGLRLKSKPASQTFFCFASAQKHLYLYINISAYKQLTVSKSALGKAANRYQQALDNRPKRQDTNIK
jgi:hypothetical protein